MAVVLVVSADGQFLDLVVEELEAATYAVRRVSSAQAALAAVRGSSPDAIVVAAALPDADTDELCRLLRSAPRVTPHTPIFIVGELGSRDARLAALRAGASDIFTEPIDGAELLSKLDAYAQLKTLAEQMQSASHVDRETGLYNLEGLARRVEELGALSVRAHGALACVVLAIEVEDKGALPEVSVFCAQAIKGGVRHSDVPGRIAAAEFAVVAPRTSANGAIQLAQRLAGEMRRRSHDAAGAVPSFQLRAGYDAISNVAYAPASTGDLLLRARRAWHDTDPSSRLGWIRPFED
jgi:two-component system cell cycle response regulator